MCIIIIIKIESPPRIFSSHHLCRLIPTTTVFEPNRRGQQPQPATCSSPEGRVTTSQLSSTSRWRSQNARLAVLTLTSLNIISLTQPQPSGGSPALLPALPSRHACMAQQSSNLTACSHALCLSSNRSRDTSDDLCWARAGAALLLRQLARPRGARVAPSAAERISLRRAGLLSRSSVEASAGVDTSWGSVSVKEYDGQMAQVCMSAAGA